MLQLVILFSFVATISAYLYFKFARTLHLAKAFCGPPSLPIIGHGHLLIGKAPEAYMALITGYIEKYGNTIKIWIGPEFNILTGDLRDVEVILGTTKFNDKAHEYKTMEPWLNEGLLVSRGKKWFQRRRIITPAFHFKILEQYIDVFDKGSRKMIEILESHRDKDSVNLYNFVTLCTLDVICGKYYCDFV